MKSPTWLAWLALGAMTASAGSSDDIAGITREARIPAVAWALKLPGQPVELRTLGTGIDRDTPFRFGSITKTFTAIALLKAAGRRGLDPSTPVDRVLPGTRAANSFDAPIRIIDLAGLAAGHTDISFEAFGDNTPRPLAEAVQRNRDVLVPLWPPGLLHSYTNATPGLSAQVIEALTGQGYEQAMQQLLFEPLGLKSASFAPAADLPGGFGADGTTPIPYWHVTFKAFGGLNMSINDMATMLTALLRGGRTATGSAWSPSIHDALLTPVASLAADAGVQIGYGAGVYSRVRHGRVWHGHGGDADGYRARYAFLPDADAGYAVVINTDNPAALARLERVLESEIAGVLPPSAVKTPVSRVADSRFDGIYYPATVRFGRSEWQACRSPRTTLRAAGNTLFVSSGDRRQRYSSLGGNRYASPGEVHARMALVEDASGVAWFVGDAGNFVRIGLPHSARRPTLPAFLPDCLPE